MKRFQPTALWLLIGLLASLPGSVAATDANSIDATATRAKLLVGRWYTEQPEPEEKTDNYYLVVRTSRGRYLLKSLYVDHKAKRYCYETQLGRWSLEGKRYTEIADDQETGADLDGEVLELNTKRFRYRMVWEDDEGEQEDLIVETRVVGPEYPLPRPPKGYAKVSIDEYYGSEP